MILTHTRAGCLCVMFQPRRLLREAQPRQGGCYVQVAALAPRTKQQAMEVPASQPLGQGPGRESRASTEDGHRAARSGPCSPARWTQGHSRHHRPATYPQKCRWPSGWLPKDLSFLALLAWPRTSQVPHVLGERVEGDESSCPLAAGPAVGSGLQRPPDPAARGRPAGCEGSAPSTW